MKEFKDGDKVTHRVDHERGAGEVTYAHPQGGSKKGWGSVRWDSGAYSATDFDMLEEA